jgi:hypothetical protein
MAKKQPRKANQRVPRTVLRLPDLDQAKSAVLNSFSSIDAQRGPPGVSGQKRINCLGANSNSRRAEQIGIRALVRSGTTGSCLC